MRPPVRSVAQILAEALSAPGGLAVGIVLGRPVTAWADVAVIECWANGEPAPDADAAAISIQDRNGRVVLLVPIRWAGGRYREDDR